jgi:pimeloyl-ACP methyl ester carboxylesterase
MYIRPQRGATARFAANLARELAMSALGAKSIDEVCADAIVRAPNAGRRVPPAAPGEIRLEVAAPLETLSLAMVGPPAPRATVFVLHGIRDSKESMRGWADMLSENGYRAVLIDLRGHGRSTGDVLTYGVRESLDLTQVLSVLEGRGLVVGPVGAMGNSYGAAVAIQWAGLDPRVATVVSVSCFASLRSVVARYAPLPRPLPLPFVNRVVDLAGARAGFDPDAASPVEAVRRTRAPILLIHGRNDARIDPAHAERIHAAGADHTELVVVEGAGHVSVTGAPQTRLAERASNWFATHLR